MFLIPNSASLSLLSPKQLPNPYLTFLDEHLNATIQIIIKMIIPMMITMISIMV